MTDFQVDGNNLLTDWVLDMTTTFHLKFFFTGEYEEGCELSFSILDTEEMFTLELKFNDLYCYDKAIFQNSRQNGKWNISKRDVVMPDIGTVNGILVRVTDTHFKVAINNVELVPTVEVDIERLIKFRGIKISRLGSCTKVDLENSRIMRGLSFRFCFI